MSAVMASTPSCTNDQIRPQLRAVKSVTFTRPADVSALLAQAVEAADGLAWIKAHAGSIPLLTAEEERELARRWQQSGDLEARDRLVLANLRLALNWARRTLERSAGATGALTMQDLTQEAVLGLLRAIDAYDPTVYRLSTYATWWMNQKMWRAIETDGDLIRMPVYAKQALRQVKYLQAKAAQAGAGPLTIEELANVTGQTAQTIEAVSQFLVAPDSLNRLVGHDEDAELEQFQAAPGTNDAFEQAERPGADGRWILTVAIQAMRRRYGGSGSDTVWCQSWKRDVALWWLRMCEPDLTYSEIAARVGVALSKERVRQIINRVQQVVEPSIRQALREQGRSATGDFLMEDEA